MESRSAIAADCPFPGPGMPRVGTERRPHGDEGARIEPHRCIPLQGAATNAGINPHRHPARRLRNSAIRRRSHAHIQPSSHSRRHHNANAGADPCSDSNVHPHCLPDLNPSSHTQPNTNARAYPHADGNP